MGTLRHYYERPTPYLPDSYGGSAPESVCRKSPLKIDNLGSEEIIRHMLTVSVEDE